MSDPPPIARRPTGRWHRALTLLVAGLLLGLVGVPASSGAMAAAHRGSAVEYAKASTTPSPPTTQVINLTDAPAFAPRFGGTPGFPLVNVSTNLTLTLSNQGTFVHTFTLAKVPNVKLNTSWSPVQLDQWFAKNGSLANVSLAGGARTNVTLDFNSSVAGDSLEFVSLVPYQFQAGMFGFLNLSAGPGFVLFDNATTTLSFVPNSLAVENVSTYPVSLNVRVANTGALAHTWTLAGVPNATLFPANFTTYFQTHPPLVSVAIPTAVGVPVWANFTIRSPGVYQYICTIPGHFASGMTGFLYIGVTPPPPPPTPSTAVVQVGILAGTAVLVVIGAALALAATFTGRFPRRPDGEHPPGH